MDVSQRWCMPFCVVCLTVGLAVGCGGSSKTSQPQAQTTESADKSAPPAAAINGSASATPDTEQTEPVLTSAGENTEPEPPADMGDGPDQPEQTAQAPEKGSPEWLVREITQLKLAPLPATEEVAKLREHRRERNMQIIKLSEEAVAKSHTDKAREQVFFVAARHLLDARYELALQGKAEDIDALFTDAQALINRDKQSPIANMASFTLVNLAYNLAKRPQNADKSWVKEFASQATFFGSTYPKETLRGPSMLFNAGRSCELHGLPQEAIGCYVALQNSFPSSPFSVQSVGMLRRLRLTGGPAQITGPTLDGKEFTSDDLLGKPLLVVFWASVAKPFEQQLPKIKDAVKKHAASGLVVVGVNLDSEPEAVQEFAAKHKLNWPQIFFPDAERRGWNHPLAAYYGVVEIPAYWLIDSNGAVATTTVTADELDAKLAEVLSGVAPAKRTPAKQKSVSKAP